MSQPAIQPTIFQEVPDFSLVMGGPLFQLFRRAHLSGDGGQLLRRRIIVITAIVWVPLLVLSAFRGLAGGVALPFLDDVQTHVRSLVALPLLIAAELLVHVCLRSAVQEFVARKIIVAEELPKFRAAIDSAMRLRNSLPLEMGLLLLVYAGGGWIWWKQIVLSPSSWFAIPGGGHMNLTAAGYWNLFVSVPVFQFILLRWYLRLLIWIRFLWQVSRLSLHIIPTHPDRTGGLSFLGKTSYAFGPILFAQGAMLSGSIANHVLYGGRSLRSYDVETVGLVAFFLLVILGPLTAFTPQLTRAKRKGLADYGLLANNYVAGFEKKWVQEAATHQDELLGSSDLQSLADLGNSYDVVREMRPVPFGIQDIAKLAAATAVPLVPLGLTVFSLEELVIRLLKVLF